MRALRPFAPPMRLFFSALITLVLVANGARAQDTNNPVKWEIDSLPALPAGSKIIVPLTATIAAGWHVYSLTQGPGGPMPTHISLPKGTVFTQSDSIKADAPESRFDQNFGIQVETYETRAAFGVPVLVAPTAKAGSDTLMIFARYQVCNASTCLPAKLETIKRVVQVETPKVAKKSKTTS